jgi:hypothetical protein
MRERVRECSDVRAPARGISVQALLRCQTHFVAFCCFLFSPAHASVTWEEQAERLQNVSATLLDGVPFGEPVQRSVSVEARAGVSFLPKVNARVGAKKEEVPASPVHAVPTLQGNIRLQGVLPGAASSGVQVWAGYLPAGAEKVLGLEASLTQWAAGAALQQGWQVGSMQMYVVTGAQYSDARIQGAITEKNAKDSFRAQTTLASGGTGLVHAASGFWSNVLVGGKKTTSVFEIPSDSTKFSLSDSLADSSLPLFAQAGTGWLHASGLQLGVAALWVPKRLVMPRLLASYQYAF